MSMGKVSNNRKLLIFTKDDVKVSKEEEVLVTFRDKPVFVCLHNKHGWYRIPLDQRKQGQWRPRSPSKKTSLQFLQANSVYNLTSKEHVIKWMHAVYGYTVKSTWVKAIKAGNFVEWSLLTVKTFTNTIQRRVKPPRDTW